MRNHRIGLICWIVTFISANVMAGDLEKLRETGVLRHLGVPYAAFVTGSGEGFDVQMMKAFAAHLGVEYKYVPTEWKMAIPDLTGKNFVIRSEAAEVTGDCLIRGDVLANGLTVLPWRKTLLAYSTPTFPSQVWLVVRADSPVDPIVPSGDVNSDIKATRAKLQDMKVLCKTGTCLDPRLFNLEGAGAKPLEFPASLNDLAPAVILGEAESTLLDVPDAVMALQKFPGRIKVIGPLSDMQLMAVGFRKDQPELLAEFNSFFSKFWSSGAYLKLVNEYYPLIHRYFPDFFAR